MKLGIDAILSRSKTPPSIVLQADEGPYISKDFKGLTGEKIDWKQLSEDALRMHMRILNAYYLPGSGKNALYKSISPVNTFRVIFNSYFGANYELLADESFIVEDLKHPFKFVNVTDKVKYE